MLAIGLTFQTARAQRRMERLDRSVTAQKTADGNFVQWRITADEWYDVAYNLYRDGAKLNDEPITGASNWTDAAGGDAAVYTVTSLRRDGEGRWVESEPSAGAAVRKTPYIALKVKPREGDYYLNDATAADLDGDGAYEIIVKRCYGGADKYQPSCTQFSYFEAYKLDGTFLWEICLGPNILPDVEMNIAAFDFDEDGRAEVFLRTSEGTVFGDGTEIGDVGNEAGAFTPDGVTNYRYGTSQEANMSYIIYGPEMLSLVDGATGRELDRVPFIPRGKASDWGDGYGHRCSKYFFGAPYLDGVHPSLFIGRGIYTQTKMRTYDIVDKKMVLRWSWESGTSGAYYGQGNHNYTIADVDWDGRDEITWGSMAVDENGQKLYSTGMGHGDAMHVGDFDPYRKGQEVFSCLESTPQCGILFRDATTGQILLHKTTSSDCGRCCAGNISDRYRGAELWGGGYGYAASDLDTPLNHFGVAENYTIYWDGDLLKEILDHQDFTAANGYGYGAITKLQPNGLIETLLKSKGRSCNYTKGTPCLQADILGDWREEAIWHSDDEQYLYIYTTPYPTDYRFYTLMHDHQYRQAICWQMCGYNQPPHPSFFLGSAEGIVLPPPPSAVNGKGVWMNGQEVWQAGTPLQTWSGDTLAYADGADVLLDVSASADRKSAVSLRLGSDVAPRTLTVNSPADYTLDGDGHALTGAGRLDKLGEGTLLLKGQHEYTGPTEVWGGTLQLDGRLSGDVWLNRFTALSGRVTLGGGLKILYDADFRVADTARVEGTVAMDAGAKLSFTLSACPSDAEVTALTAAGGKDNAYLLAGGFSYEPGAVININMMEDGLGAGRYVLMASADSLPDVSGLKLTGLKGYAGSLSAEGNLLMLTVKGVRKPSEVYWTGSEDNVWNLSQSENWQSAAGEKEVFVTGDTVVFDDRGLVGAVTLSDELSPAMWKVSADSIDYTLDGDGSLTGGMVLSKSGQATLTVNNRNAFTGKTSVSGGTLVLKYLPTVTGNGGIGTSLTSPSFLEVSNGAELRVTTAGETTSRGLTAGNGGMVLNTPVDLTWKGTLTGSTLTKKGSAMLRLSGVNTGLKKIVLEAGTLHLDETDSQFTSSGQAIQLNGGTLKFNNNVNSYSTADVNLSLPEGKTATVWLDGRCTYNGSLTGAGTLNLVTDFVRADLKGNWSAFSGKITVTANSANSSYGDDMRIANTYGLPKAWLDVQNGVTVYPTTSGTKFVTGHLTGTSGAIVQNFNLETGSLNRSGTFAGVISGTGNVTKVGSGVWTLSGANTYTGSTLVQNGTILLKGSLASKTVTVRQNGILSLGGKVSGNLVLNAGRLVGAGGTVTGNLTSTGGVISPGDSTAIARLTISGTLTMDSTSVLELQVTGGSFGACDQLKLSKPMTCGGTLRVGQLKEDAIEAYVTYKLIDGQLQGQFKEVILPELPDGLQWNTTLLSGAGTLFAVKAAGLSETDTEAGIVALHDDGVCLVGVGTGAAELDFTVVNLQGQTVARGTADASSGVIEVDVAALSRGIYLIRLNGAGKNWPVLKLMKNN